MTKLMTYDEAVETLELGASVYYDGDGECIYPFGHPTQSLMKGTIYRLIKSGIVAAWTPTMAVESGEFATPAEAEMAMQGQSTEYVYIANTSLTQEDV